MPMWKAFTIQPYGRFRIPATFTVDYHHFGVFFGSEYFSLCCCPKIDTFQMY
jgi:hypothetical protein